MITRSPHEGTRERSGGGERAGIQPPGPDAVRPGEEIVEPELRMVDAHHHLYVRDWATYLLDDYMRDAAAGHRIDSTVYVESKAFLRDDGDEALRPVGEVEFAEAAARVCEERRSPCRVARAIVGHVDMRLGDEAARTMDGSLAASPRRYRGVRQIAISHPDVRVMSFLAERPPADLLGDTAFRQAFRHLAPRSLTFDATVLHPQLPELCALADAFPDTRIALVHLGLATPESSDPTARLEAFGEWRSSLDELARRPNVFCKVGGLGTTYWGFGLHEKARPVGHEELASLWKPYVETAVEAFGASRCMVSSNFPNDRRSCEFVTLWNAIKTITRQYTSAERSQLHAKTAEAFYRMEADPGRGEPWESPERS